MKTLNVVVKILAALAAVAGAVYVVATYGDKIVTWAKSIWAKLPQCPACEEVVDAEVAEEAETVEEAAEEAPAEEAVEEVVAEEVPVEVVVAEHEPVAEETDFAE